MPIMVLRMSPNGTMYALSPMHLKAQDPAENRHSVPMVSLGLFR